MPLSERLKELINERGVTSYELSANTGISQGTLSRILNGHTKKLSIRNNERLSKYFNVEPTWLATGRGERKEQATTSKNELDFSSLIMSTAKIAEAVQSMARSSETMARSNEKLAETNGKLVETNRKIYADNSTVLTKMLGVLTSMNEKRAANLDEKSAVAR